MPITANKITLVDIKGRRYTSSNGTELVENSKKLVPFTDVNLPSNIATIDKDGELGNVYDKTQVDGLLGDKLYKPTITDDGQNYTYVVLVDEFGDSAKAPAGDLGKNSANADLTTTGTRTFTQAHIYTHNTAGFHYRITGLPNKTSDPSFNLKLVMDAKGQLAVSDRIDTVINLPDRLNYSTGTPNLNITITKIEQTITAPSNPNFSNEIKEIMKSLFNYELTPYTAEDYGITDRTDIRLNSDTYLSKITNKLLTNKIFDSNDDFVVKIENLTQSCGWVTAIRREASMNSNEYVRGGDCYKGYKIGFYIKKQNILFFIGYVGNGAWDTSIWNIPIELGNIRFLISANKISYKILN